jgi:predicted enzyme related to lactoylglutathione lyase
MAPSSPDPSPTSPTGPVGWLRAVVFDAEDPDRLAAFWQSVLGVSVVEQAPDWIQLAPGRGGAFVAIEPAEAATSPASHRTRPDLEVEDMEVARARIEDLGGRLVEVIHARPGESHYRMADPEGNEFTVVLPLPEDVARRTYGPSGQPAPPPSLGHAD